MAKKRKKQQLNRNQKRRMRMGNILFAIMGLIMILTMLIGLLRW
jgi:hypothetical protein